MAAKKKTTQRTKTPGKPGAPPSPVSTGKPPVEAPPPQVGAAPTEAKRGPPVVGIGASAGGLEAFKRFFTAMPADSGLAFVLIPHLDPAHESLMVELLTRNTAMPVVEATEGMSVAANQVYILPPNKYMTMTGGQLRLTGPVARGGLQTSIDLFLRSLAEDQQEKAICIILSGTGAHGTLGLKAVKAAGGMAMVQDPATADYPSMPQSAVATGLADFVLPPEQMPEALRKYIQHPYVLGAPSAPEGAEPANHLGQVLAVLRAHAKLDFRPYRKRMLSRRIERRMSLIHINNIADYLNHLRNHPDEVKHLVRDLLISVTSFFRDAEAWQALAGELAARFRAKEPDDPVRAWSVGCATGEEPYSIGMVILEQLAAQQKPCPVQIFATDIDEEALEMARQAIYPEGIAADVAPERLARFFTRLNGIAYRVGKQLREIVIYARQNLLANPPFSKLDLIVCRNLLIYLEPETQQKVISLLHFALNEGGLLFLGSAETIGRNTDLFEPVSGKWRIYRRIGPVRAAALEFPAFQFEGHQATPQLPSRPQPVPKLAELAQHFLLRRFALACVVINRQFEVLYFAGPTENFLTQPVGMPTQNLLELARPGLEPKLRSAVQRAIRENAPQHVEDIPIHLGGLFRRVRIDVEPLRLTKQADNLLIVAFQEQTPSESKPVSEAAPRAQTPEWELLQQLEHELEVTRESLQTTIEEMESSNEELKASNEEYMSMNEEYQSANEELETAKEELQSLNEELGTVNHQLQDKVQDLERANNDIANLFNSTDIATIFLDTTFRIKRFTPAATKLFHFIATDVGRPLENITSCFDGPGLLTDAAQVLQQLAPREREVTGADGTWWLQRITPYRTADHQVDGVVITFVNITERKRADAAVRHLAAIVESSADAIFSKSLDGTIRSWNKGAERLYGYSAAEMVGHSIRRTIPADRVEEWTQQMARLAHGESVEQHETERLSKDGRRIPVALTYSPIRNAAGTVVSVSAIVRDISERKRAEEALRASEERFRQMADQAPVMIWLSGTDKLCTWFNKPWLDFTGRSLPQVLGNGWADSVHTDDYDRCLNTYVTAFDARETFTMEYRLKRYDGEYRWVLDHGIPLHGVGDEFVGYIGSCVDFTEHKRDQEELQRLSTELRAKVEELTTLLDIIPCGVLMADPQCHRITANHTFYPMLGLSPGSNLSLTSALSEMPPGTRVYRDGRELPPDEFPMQVTGRTGQRVVDFDHDIVFPDGRTITLLASTAPLLDPNGGVRGVVGAYVDITERKRAEVALQASEERLWRMMENAHIGITFGDAQGRILQANRTMLKLVGWSAEDLHAGKLNCAGLCRSEDQDQDRLAMSELAKASSVGPAEKTLLRTDGTPIPVLISALRLDGQRNENVTFVVDLSAQKRAEEAIRDREARLTAIVDAAMDAIITIDHRGIIQSVNAATERMFGYSAEEMIGQNVSMLMASPDREAHDDHIARYLRTGEAHVIGRNREVEARRKDGTIFPTDLALSEIKELQLFTGIHRDLTDRKRLEREVVEAASLEQRRIGHDLHDTVAQELTALNLLAKELTETLRSAPANAITLLGRLTQGLQRSQKELRAVLHGLLPVAVDSQGLMAALADLADRTKQEGRVACTFACPADVAVPDNLTATHLYLIAQEAVYNAVKHA